MTVARRIVPNVQQTHQRVGRCESLDTMLASIVAIQAGSLERFEAGAAMMAAMAERFVMTEDDRAALLTLLRAHVAEIHGERERLASLRKVTFVFADEDDLLVVPTAA
jgi:hypothetical protein